MTLIPEVATVLAAFGVLWVSTESFGKFQAGRPTPSHRAAEAGVSQAVRQPGKLD